MHLNQYREFINSQSCKESIGAAYSKKNPHLIELGISSQHFGDICRGVRRPGPKLAMKLANWSHGEVTLDDLYAFYEKVQESKQSPKPHPR